MKVIDVIKIHALLKELHEIRCKETHARPREEQSMGFAAIGKINDAIDALEKLEVRFP